jgi:nanoRNase/pAp phosphatase (c-di-AMP/oligoRNAs hydrolase)
MANAVQFDLDGALKRLEGAGPVLILTHDNPDPDSMAAAWALATLLQGQISVPSTIGMGGIIGRAENRAMVETLALPVTPIEKIDLKGHPLTALVDTQPGTGNNSLPAGRNVDIVIDHHPPRPESANAAWCDIQPGLGASSTIAYGYLRRRGVSISPPLATALLYAIKTETRDLGREATELELEAYVDLIGRADQNALHRIASPKVGPERFAALDRALHRATLYGDLCVANLGALDYPDLVAEIADLLLPLRAAHWVMCVGRHAGRAVLSVRTDVPDARCGSLMRKVVGSEGSSGGHGQTAGGRLYARVDDDHALGELYNLLVVRLAAELGVAGKTPLPLLPL